MIAGFMRRPGLSVLLSGVVFALALLAPAARAEPKLVAIANFGPNPALSDLIAGFKASLAANGFVEGKDVTFDERHVNFDRSLVPQMLNVMAAANPALMLTITTPLTAFTSATRRSRWAASRTVPDR